MDLVQQLVLLSRKLCETLATIEDKDEQRTNKIELINKLLDARGQTIDKLMIDNPKPLKGHKDELELRQLNEKIITGLEKLKGEIILDLRQLQVSAKSEQRYVNPYSHLRNLDGTYIDKRE